jgi:hypothetical protein
MEAKHEYCRALFSPFPLAEETKIRLFSQGSKISVGIPNKQWMEHMETLREPY